ncbi:hypothetical protein [Marinobacter sp. LN3S78]|uniref:hypothetical protein n=1 Tax=Marinobacter sp. LN3S78 TaxID=3382300 RepID=UPI00387B03B8
MSIFAGKLHFPFEPKMAVALDATGETRTPDILRPSLGSLAVLQYKPAKLAFHMILSDEPTSGAATVKVYAGESELATVAVTLEGNSVISGSTDIDLSTVRGQTALSVSVDVTGAADAGITATLDAVLGVDLPVVQSGC